MKDIEVRIVTLEPIHVASAHGFGPSPEPLAWEQITDYMKRQGLIDKLESLRFFGFNNPSPTPGSPNYGYEQWVTVGPDAQPEEGIEIKDFAGGLYAVTRSTLAEIGESWQALVAWREKGGQYRYGGHQWLEESLNYDPDKTVDEQGPEKMIFDLYMPIA